MEGKELGFVGVVLAVIVALLIWRDTNIKNVISKGNPNYPSRQYRGQIGPQGPNDGSNSYDDSGHTVSPVFGGAGGSASQYSSRGFAYGASDANGVY